MTLVVQTRKRSAAKKRRRKVSYKAELHTYHLVKESDLELSPAAGGGGGGDEKVTDMSGTVTNVHVISWQILSVVTQPVLLNHLAHFT